MDLTLRTARLPLPGETLAGQSFQTGFGGKGANQAVMAAQLGGLVRMIGSVGRDLFGEQILSHLRALDIDTRAIRIDDERPTGVAVIVVDDAAQNSILLVPGANYGLTVQDVETAADAIRQSQILIAQLEVSVEATVAAFRLAKAAGVFTILNPAPAQPLPGELLRQTDLCVPNEPEAEQLTGQPASTLSGAEAAARRLLARGSQAVIVTLGRQGCLAVDEEGADHLPAPAVAAVDTTGAGDAFVGSLAVFLAAGLPLRQAARRAGMAAALSVTRPGAQSSFPSQAEVDNFLSRGLQETRQ
jgi:ribokinase